MANQTTTVPSRFRGSDLVDEFSADGRLGFQQAG
jgi:hypothetical protein